MPPNDAGEAFTLRKTPAGPVEETDGTGSYGTLATACRLHIGLLLSSPLPPPPLPTRNHWEYCDPACEAPDNKEVVAPMIPAVEAWEACI